MLAGKEASMDGQTGGCPTRRKRLTVPIRSVVDGTVSDAPDGQADKFINQFRKPFSLALGVTVLHGHILVFDPAERTQAVFESLNEGWG
jgi:hypothetical protein